MYSEFHIPVKDLFLPICFLPFFVLSPFSHVFTERDLIRKAHSLVTRSLDDVNSVSEKPREGNKRETEKREGRSERMQRECQRTWSWTLMDDWRRDTV